MQDLSQGVVSDAKLEPLIKKQIQDLSHALTCKKHTYISALVKEQMCSFLKLTLVLILVFLFKNRQH